MKVSMFGSSRPDTTNIITTTLQTIAALLAGSSFTPYDTLTAETELTVGAVLQNVLTSVAGTRYLVTLYNASAGGQKIRFGTAPAFGAPNVGQLLIPGAAAVLENISINVNAIADAAGGLLSVLIYEVS